MHHVRLLTLKIPDWAKLIQSLPLKFPPLKCPPLKCPPLNVGLLCALLLLFSCLQLKKSQSNYFSAHSVPLFWVKCRILRTAHPLATAQISVAWERGFSSLTTRRRGMSLFVHDSPHTSEVQRQRSPKTMLLRAQKAGCTDNMYKLKVIVSASKDSIRHTLPHVRVQLCGEAFCMRKRRVGGKGESNAKHCCTHHFETQCVSYVRDPVFKL